MGLGIRQRTQTFIVFLAGCIPQRQLHFSTIDDAVCHVVFENGRLLEVEGLAEERTTDRRLENVRTSFNSHSHIPGDRWTG